MKKRSLMSAPFAHLFGLAPRAEEDDPKSRKAKGRRAEDEDEDPDAEEEEDDPKSRKAKGKRAEEENDDHCAEEDEPDAEEDEDEPKSRKAKGKGKRAAGPRIQVSVYPTLVPDSHVIASVNDVFNAVFVRGDVVGDTLYYGRGAGKDATASAVLSDLADAALDLRHDTANRVPPFVAHEDKGSVLPIEETVSRYYVRLSVADKAGVIAKVASILSTAGISIASIIQPEGHEGETVPLVLMLHAAPYAALAKALKAIGKLPSVKADPAMLRVEDFS